MNPAVQKAKDMGHEHIAWLLSHGKYVLFYLGLIVGAVVSAAEVGWIHTPAKSQTVEALTQKVDERDAQHSAGIQRNADEIEMLREDLADKLETQSRSIHTNTSAIVQQTEQLRGVNDKLGAIDRSLGVVVESLLNRRSDLDAIGAPQR